MVCGKPQFYTGRGTFSLRLSEIRAVGLGELLARIAMLRQVLDAEGLFDPRLKRPLPFPAEPGRLITGRGGAEHDVTTVAAGRWPAVRFGSATPRCRAQCRRADRGGTARTRRPFRVDVIVIARAAAASRTCFRSPTRRCAGRSRRAARRWSAPSATSGQSLCDLVADLRGHPTDAAKKVVPDTAAEQALVADLRHLQRTGAAQVGPRTAS